jgi:hypothetical protein
MKKTMDKGKPRTQLDKPAKESLGEMLIWEKIIIREQALERSVNKEGLTGMRGGR